MNMTRRFAFAVATVVLGASCAAGFAEAQFAPQGQPVYSPTGYGEHQHGGGHQCPVCMMSGSSVSQSWATPITPGYDQPSRFYREAYDDLTDDGYRDYGASPFDAMLLSASRGIWMRLEYLNYSYKEPEGTPLGAPLLGTPNILEPFNVTVAGQLAGVARVPTIEAVDMSHRNGIRSTLGIPLPAGRGGFEASIFWMQDDPERTQEFDLGPPVVGSTDPARFIVTSTLTNGVPGNNIFIYDLSYRTRSSIDIWGGELNWVSDPYASGPGLQIRPLVGLRYLNIAEQLVQEGSFDQQGQLATPLDSVITSRSDNAAYIPQVGVRLEIVHPRFVLGVEPKLGAGFADINNTVVTERLRSPGDPTITSQDNSTKLTAAGEISLYGKVNVTENMTVNFGYSFLFIDNVSRAYSSILYNDNGPLADADVVARQTHELMYYQGLNLGAEFRY